MSPREKKLLISFALVGFIILNFLGYGFYTTKRAAVNSQYGKALTKLETAEMFRESREQVTDEMDWLAEHEPQPAANQDVQSKLQEICDSGAKSAGLEIKGQKPQSTDTTGKYYHRARMEISVNGSEEALYRWFDGLNAPTQLRMATSILVSPNNQDDTKIDCKAVVEQWFVPLPPDA